MKSLVIIFCTFFSVGVVAQEIKLKAFDLEHIELDTREKLQKDPVYQYITENYKPLSAKENVASPDDSTCGFTQTFEGGITYTKRNCEDAAIPAGELITITNPDRSSITDWVEALNSILHENDNNMWNFEQSTYRPVGGFPGAFFEIYRERDHTKVLVMSGC